MLKELLRWWAEWRLNRIAENYPDVAKNYVVKSEPYTALELTHNEGMKAEKQRYSRLEKTFAKEAEKYQGSANQIKEQGFLIEGLRKGLESKIEELQRVNDTIAKLNNKLAQYDPALIDSYKKQIKDLTNIASWTPWWRGAYYSSRAQMRTYAHKTCVEAQEEREKDIVIVLNHAGFITGMTPAAKELFGNIKGHEYYDLIDGSDSDKKQIGERLTSLIPTEGELLYVNTVGKKGKDKQRAKINVYPKFFDFKGANREPLTTRHSTVIEFEVGGWLWAWRMYRSGKRCMQDTLAKDLSKDIKTDADIEKMVEEAEQGAQDAIAEIDKKTRGKNK